MLHLASKVRGATVQAVDGDIGTVDDFYFEPSNWAVRYLVVDTGTWLSGRRVLLSPMSVRGPWGMGRIPVSLTRDQVRDSPALDLSNPPSRHGESDILGYYGYPSYGGMSSVWGIHDSPGALVMAPVDDTPSSRESSRVTLHERGLRSTSAITGYHLQAVDAEIGHVDDFLIGENSWRIRYLRVDTSNWIGGRSVFLAADSLQWIDQEAGKLHVALTRDEVKRGPSLDSMESMIAAGEIGPPFVII
jgi:hypothetical protein